MFESEMKERKRERKERKKERKKESKKRKIPSKNITTSANSIRSNRKIHQDFL